jgi:DNA ligase-1
MKLPTLYKRTKTGAIEEWEISWDDGSYTITHGQVDGAKQEKSNSVSGKNIGKANETSNLEQAESEALSRWKKQIDKGYSQNIKKLDFTIPKPMLAHDFKKYNHKIEYPCYVQPKLDGVRCLAYLEDDEIVLLSRQGKKYTVPVVQEDLYNLLTTVKDPPVLDGELYIHGVDFQKLVSWVKKEQSDTMHVEYHVYDCVLDEPFHKRWNKYLSAILSPKGQLRSVETQSCNNEEEISEFHSAFVKDGYEGSIIRYGKKGYESGYRSQNLLKLKDFVTDEFEIIGAEQDEHKPAECTFLLQTVDGTPFRCKCEGTQEFREDQWSEYQSDSSLYIGHLMTVRYFEMTTSENPVPRFPVGVSIRDYD